VYLHPDLQQFFSNTEPLFDQIMALRGECFRHQDGRMTQRIKLGDRYYFIKQHTGVGWKEIVKNLFQLRLPVISAENEWHAIAKLKSVGINVPVVVGYGKRGVNPAKLESFILMEALAPTISLEDWCQHWKKTPPSFVEKRMLLAEVARIARVLHENGMNHRDFYICHFLLHQPLVLSNIKLSLIDLHRVQIRHKTPERWIIKDLAGLYFSCKDTGLTQRDFYRFMVIYRQQSLRELLSGFNREAIFWQKVKARGNTYRDHTK
jgi:heptose I phosphotransferase